MLPDFRRKERKEGKGKEVDSDGYIFFPITSIQCVIFIIDKNSTTTLATFVNLSNYFVYVGPHCGIKYKRLPASGDRRPPLQQGTEFCSSDKCRFDHGTAVW